MSFIFRFPGSHALGYFRNSFFLESRTVAQGTLPAAPSGAPSGSTEMEDLSPEKGRLILREYFEYKDPKYEFKADAAQKIKEDTKNFLEEATTLMTEVQQLSRNQTANAATIATKETRVGELLEEIGWRSLLLLDFFDHQIIRDLITDYPDFKDFIDTPDYTPMSALEWMNIPLTDITDYENLEKKVSTVALDTLKTTLQKPEYGLTSARVNTLVNALLAPNPVSTHISVFVSANRSTFEREVVNKIQALKIDSSSIAGKRILQQVMTFFEGANGVAKAPERKRMYSATVNRFIVSLQSDRYGEIPANLLSAFRDTIWEPFDREGDILRFIETDPNKFEATLKTAVGKLRDKSGATLPKTATDLITKHVLAMFHIPTILLPPVDYDYWKLSENFPAVWSYLRERGEEKQKTRETAREERENLNEKAKTKADEWHDAFMIYRKKLLPAKGAEWVEADKTEYFAGSPEKSHWFKNDTELAPGVLDTVLANPEISVITPEDVYRFEVSTTSGPSIIKATGAAMISVLRLGAGNSVLLGTTSLNAPAAPSGTPVDQIITYSQAIEWVHGLEQDIWDEVKPGGQQAKIREAMDRANELMEGGGNQIGALFSGAAEQFINGTGKEQLEVAFAIFALYKLFKAASPKARMLVFALGGAYAIDAMQARHTNWFGGERLFDMLTMGQLSDIRETPLGAFLSEAGKKDQIEQKAGLVMMDATIEELLDWAHDVNYGLEVDMSADGKTPGDLYYRKMPKKLQKRFDQLFPRYGQVDNFRAARVMWEVFEAFLLRSAKKAKRTDVHDQISPDSAFDGAQYLLAKYTNKKIVEARFEQYRNDIGALHKEYKDPTKFSRVLEHEMTRFDIEQAINRERTLLERVQAWGLEQYEYLLPVLEGSYEWTKEQLSDLFTYLEEKGFPKAEQLVRDIAATGWRIGAETYDDVQDGITLFWNKHQVTIKEFGKMAYDVFIEFPVDVTVKTARVVKQNLPWLLTSLKSMGKHAVEWGAELIGFPKSDVEREQVSPTTAKGLYEELEKLDLIDKIKKAYRIDEMESATPPGGGGQKYNIPILRICEKLMADPGGFGKKLQDFISEAEADQYKRGEITWSIGGGATTNGTSKEIQFGTLKEIPRWLLGRAFLVDIVAVQALDEYVLDTGKDVIEIVVRILKGMADIATVGWDTVEAVIWRVLEAVHPHTIPNISAIKKTLIVRDIIDLDWNDSTPEVIWEYNKYVELMEGVKKTISTDMEATIFETTAKKLFSEVLYRASPDPAFRFVDSTGAARPTKAMVEAELKNIAAQIILYGRQYQFGGFPGNFIEDIVFEKPATAPLSPPPPGQPERWKLFRPGP